MTSSWTILEKKLVSYIYIKLWWAPAVNNISSNLGNRIKNFHDLFNNNIRKKPCKLYMESFDELQLSTTNSQIYVGNHVKSFHELSATILEKNSKLYRKLWWAPAVNNISSNLGNHIKNFHDISTTILEKNLVSYIESLDELQLNNTKKPCKLYRKLWWAPAVNNISSNLGNLCTWIPQPTIWDGSLHCKCWFSKDRIYGTG